MSDAIEIEVWALPGGVMSADARVVARAVLHEVDGGHGIYARVDEPQGPPRRGFIAGTDRENIWRLVERAARWAAEEAEK